MLGQIVHEIVDAARAGRRPRPAAPFEPPFGFAGEDRDAEFAAGVELDGVPSSIDRQPDTWNPPMATGMPASRNGRAMSSARGILVGLHADQPDQAEIAVALRTRRDQRRDVDARIGLVDRFDIDVDVRAEHLRSAQSSAMP